jgi:hypothetical protein
MIHRTIEIYCLLYPFYQHQLAFISYYYDYNEMEKCDIFVFMSLLVKSKDDNFASHKRRDDEIRQVKLRRPCSVKYIYLSATENRRFPVKRSYLLAGKKRLFGH